MDLFDIFMRLKRRPKQTTRVQFVTGADSSMIAVSDMTPAQLPETFAIETMFEIKDQKWSVLSTEPNSIF